MLNKLAVLPIVLLASGCVGLEIKPIATEKSDAAHDSGSSIEGYIVYHPMVVVEIRDKKICLKEGEDGECANWQIKCAIGEINYLPDYSKPYLINSKTGFGKSGIDVQIENGWMVSGLKDQSDNTALLDVLASAAGVSVESTPENGPGCKKAGLYKLVFLDKKMKLEDVELY